MELKSYLSWISMMTAVTGGIVVLTLIATNPTVIGPAGVTLWFVALFMAIQGASTLGLYILKSRSEQAVGPYQKLTASSRQGLLLSGVLTVSLALSSLRQLSGRDLGLILLLALLIEIYFRARP